MESFIYYVVAVPAMTLFAFGLLVLPFLELDRKEEIEIVEEVRTPRRKKYLVKSYYRYA